MSDEEELDDLILAYLFLRNKSRRRKKKKRKVWVRDIFKKRNERGVYHTLVQEMRLNDRDSYLR